MRLRNFLIIVALLCLPVTAFSQRGIRGQIFLPNGSPIDRNIRFTLMTENGTRFEYYYTDSHGRIAMPNVSSNYTIVVESDGETYDTTKVTFYPPSSGNYIDIHLKPFTPKTDASPGVVDVNRVDVKVSAKAKEAYDSALQLLYQGQYDQAVEPLKRAVSLQPDYFHAYNDLGVAYMRMKQFDQAAEAFRHAIKINDKIYLPQLNLGVVLNRQGKYAEAVEALKKLEKKHQELDSVYPPLIEALMGAQDWAQAEITLNKALAVKDADVVDLKIKLGIALARQNKAEAAVVALNDALKAEPDNALGQFNLGAALLQLERFDEAEKALRRAYEIKGSSMPAATFLLGQVYYSKKDYPKAIDAFETYLRDLPDAPNAAQVKEAIRRLREAVNKK